MDADENTRMMIQLASMMMQNQNAIREAQSQLEAVTRETVPLADISGGAHAHGLTITSASKSNGEHVPFGMDPKLMAEFARQIVMNANNVTGTETAANLKRGQTEKPATIAQIIQSQKKGQATTAKNTSEGKIFVYNQLPDENLPGSNGDAKADGNVLAAVSSAAAATNGGFRQSLGMRKSSTVGPIRNRHGRILRPGIDNFGRFEAVANPGLIMHAMELLRQKDKKKRGPKEKETFSVFMYCLPDKNSKLPKFSSLDPIERALVDQHQQEGYGYPSQDYINGIPRKTQLCLSFDEKKFRSYMTLLYPKLSGRLYDMYRIDKTRRLIRVEARSPRQLKDMKYQGSLIVIPYNTVEDRPAAVIHRNFEDVYNNNNNNNNNNNSQSLGNPLSLIQNFNIPLPGLPDVSDTSVGKVKDVENKLPVFPGQQLLTANGIEDDAKGGNGEVSTEDMNIEDEAETEVFDQVKLFQRASEIKRGLQEEQCVPIRPESIYSDILSAYRENPTLEHHKIVFCFQPQDGCSARDDGIASGSVFMLFWEEVFRRYFTGNHQKVPLLDPCAPNDLFKICGRILLHGLVLDNYFPVKFSQACLAMILTESCSAELALSSFYQVVSESEKDILESTLSELRSGAESYPTNTEKLLKIILGSYGCKSVPDIFELDTSVVDIAESFQLHQPFWALSQIRGGLVSAGLTVDDVTEDDCLQLYQTLTPTVSSLLQRIRFETSNDESSTELLDASAKKRTKTLFEEYLVKLSKNNLVKLLQKWCGYDCLCVPKLSVKFTTEEVAAVFETKEQTLYLPYECTSIQEMSQLLDVDSDARFSWDYVV